MMNLGRKNVMYFILLLIFAFLGASQVLTLSHGLSQARPRPSQSQGVWPWPGKSEAKAKESQAKAMASGQSQASTSLQARWRGPLTSEL